MDLLLEELPLWHWKNFKVPAAVADKPRVPMVAISPDGRLDYHEAFAGISLYFSFFKYSYDRDQQFRKEINYSVESI